MSNIAQFQILTKMSNVTKTTGATVKDAVNDSANLLAAAAAKATEDAKLLKKSDKKATTVKKVSTTVRKTGLPPLTDEIAKIAVKGGVWKSLIEKANLINVQYGYKTAINIAYFKSLINYRRNVMAQKDFCANLEITDKGLLRK